jgi:multidrug efflux pump subunit AcrA (membrane-fusion protein)
LVVKNGPHTTRPQTGAQRAGEEQTTMSTMDDGSKLLELAHGADPMRWAAEVNLARAEAAEAERDMFAHQVNRLIATLHTIKDAGEERDNLMPVYLLNYIDRHLADNGTTAAQQLIEARNRAIRASQERAEAAEAEARRLRAALTQIREWIDNTPVTGKGMYEALLSNIDTVAQDALDGGEA